MSGQALVAGKPGQDTAVSDNLGAGIAVPGCVGQDGAEVEGVVDVTVGVDNDANRCLAEAALWSS